MVRLLFLFLILFSNTLKAQQGYKSQNTNKKLKGWSASTEFNKKDVIAADFEVLKSTFLGKQVTPIYISKEFREYRYRNFYRDKKLRRIFKNKKAKGFRQHSSNGAGGTLVYYRANTNFELLYNKVFIVKAIYSISSLTHVAQTDDTNYVFELYNSKLGKIYYERPLHGNFLQKKTKKYGYHLVIRILNCILGL